MGRGEANIEDQFRSALAVLEGLNVTAPTDAEKLKTAMDSQLKLFLDSLLKTELGIASGKSKELVQKAESALSRSYLALQAVRPRASGFTFLRAITIG